MAGTTVQATCITHDLGRAIEIVHPLRGYPAPGAEAVLRYHYAGAPKPYFHPLLGPAGVPLTIYEPYDHLWHRGLWFTIKLLNGENFWEEQAPFGTQETEPYPDVAARADGSVAVRSSLIWRRPEGEVALKEQREWIWRATEDGFSIDWESALTPVRDTLLDRTPYTTWFVYQLAKGAD